MAEEGGGGYGDSGPSSAIGSAQRLPPPPAPQPPPPGSQAAPAPAPDQLPHNNTLVALPIVAIENILSFMFYDEISQLRLVSPPPPPGTPPPLRRPRSGEGRRGSAFLGEGAPREPSRGRRRPPAPRPPSLRPPPSAPVSGVRPEAALAPGWGRLSGAPSPPTPKRGGRWRERGRPRGSVGCPGDAPQPGRGWGTPRPSQVVCLPEGRAGPPRWSRWRGVGGVSPRRAEARGPGGSAGRADTPPSPRPPSGAPRPGSPLAVRFLTRGSR